MAVTLLINPGSSSKKYALYDEGREVLTVKFEIVVDTVEVCTVVRREQKPCELISSDDYRSSLKRVVDTALAYKIIIHPSDIKKVGVRLVAPGKFFQQHHIVDDEVLSNLRASGTKAPLHIPPTIHEIEQARIELKDSVIIAVSDSAFHDTIRKENKTYSLAKRDRDQYDISRFGYHGISIASVVRQLPSFIPKSQKVIVCHVGSGISLTALLNGESIDTTMGYSPGSGMIMGTRAGDIEPGALLELMRAKALTIQDAYSYINRECGLRGLTGEADIRRLLDKVSQLDEEAIEALEIFVARFQKLLAGLVSSLHGVDTIVFTATAVERSSILRAKLLSGLDWLGVEIDEKKNDQIVGGSGVISTESSKVTVAVIHNNETAEMMRVVENYA